MTINWKIRMRERATHLIRLLRINAPDLFLAREVFMIEDALKRFADDKTSKDARFKIESDPAWDDDAKGDG